MSSDDDFVGEDLYCDIPEVKYHPYNTAKEGNMNSSETAPVNESQSVANHYNSRPNVQPSIRNRSDIIHLRDFNNWTKSVLIREFVSQRNLKVLDLACGKGGDLFKWDKASVQHVTGVDIAQVSVDHAKERFKSMRGASFSAEFICFDAFHKPFTKGLLPLKVYDAVSCQFAFHYSFSSEESARNAVKNVSTCLANGGYFFGIIPDAQEIRRRLLDPELCKDGMNIGNQFYSLKMDNPVTDKHPSPFGIRYEFTLKDAVDTCPEYIVPFSVFRRLCEENGMEFNLEAPLPQFYETYAQIPEYQQLMHRMNIMNEEELAMCQDERDIASLYLAFAFRKIRR